MTDLSGVDISLVYSSNCADGRLQFDKGYIWIKSYIYDRPPQVKINGQSSDVFYFINHYNLIGVSFPSSIYHSFGIDHNSSLISGDPEIMLNLSVNGKDSTWKINPDVTIKRLCNGTVFGDFIPADIYYSSANKNFGPVWLPLLLLLLM